MTQSKWKRRTLQIGITILCITSAGVIGTSYGLLNYSLTPPNGQQKQSTKVARSRQFIPLDFAHGTIHLKRLVNGKIQRLLLQMEPNYMQNM